MMDVFNAKSNEIDLESRKFENKEKKDKKDKKEKKEKIEKNEKDVKISEESINNNSLKRSSSYFMNESEVLNLKKSKVSEESDQSDDEQDDYPYEVDSNDHCESPLEAYRDIAVLLSFYSSKILKKSKEDLKIYDPYFCEGSVKERLKEVGFPSVYNKKEDFYKRMEAKNFPDHDILLTNPPYSKDHMEKLVNFVAFENQSKPCCLLVPNYVYTKDYFYISQQKNSFFSNSKRFKLSFDQHRFNKIKNLFFIVPKKRYLYTTPKGRRQKKTAKFTSPFPTFWFCGNFPTEVSSYLAKELKSNSSKYEAVFAKNFNEIPFEAASENDPRKLKLKNNLKRKKNKRK